MSRQGKIRARTCPLCRKEYYSAPAMSRKDDAPICPMCGHKEALEAAGIVEGSSVYKALMQELEKGFRLQEEQARFEAEKRKGVRDGRLCKP